LLREGPSQRLAKLLANRLARVIAPKGDDAVHRRGWARRKRTSDTPHGAKEPNCLFVRARVWTHTHMRVSPTAATRLVQAFSLSLVLIRSLVRLKTRAERKVTNTWSSQRGSILPSLATNGFSPAAPGFFHFFFVCCVFRNTTRPLGRHRIDWCQPQPVFSSLAQLADGTTANTPSPLLSTVVPVPPGVWEGRCTARHP